MISSSQNRFFCIVMVGMRLADPDQLMKHSYHASSNNKTFLILQIGDFVERNPRLQALHDVAI